MGKICCLDFEDKCVTFVTGTENGWIQIWDLQNKCLIRRFRLFDPISKKVLPCNIIRVLKAERAVISYNLRTRSLLITKVLRRTAEDKSNEGSMSARSNNSAKKGVKSKISTPIASPRKKDSSNNLRKQRSTTSSRQIKEEATKLEID